MQENERIKGTKMQEREKKERKKERKVRRG